MLEYSTSGSQKGYATTAELQPRSVFQEIHEAASEAGTIADRIQALADRLLGPVAEPVSQMKDSSSNGSVLNDLSTTASILRNRASAAQRALSRIEAALP